MFLTKDWGFFLAEDTEIIPKCVFAPKFMRGGVDVFVYIHSTTFAEQLKLLSPIITMPRSDEWAA